jgi:hypothetical protein
MVGLNGPPGTDERSARPYVLAYLLVVLLLEPQIDAPEELSTLADCRLTAPDLWRLLRQPDVACLRRCESSNVGLPAAAAHPSDLSGDVGDWSPGALAVVRIIGPAYESANAGRAFCHFSATPIHTRQRPPLARRPLSDSLTREDR